MRTANARGEPAFVNKPLKLDVDSIPLFVGGLRARHIIDERSPLRGLDSAVAVSEMGITSINAVVQGHEEVYGGVIGARHVFTAFLRNVLQTIGNVRGRRA